MAPITTVRALQLSLKPIHWSSVKELFPSLLTLFWIRPHHFLFKPFLSKPFSIYMWIQCLTFIYTHCSFKSSLNTTSMKNYCQQICCLLCEYFTPTRLRVPLQKIWLFYKTSEKHHKSDIYMS